MLQYGCLSEQSQNTDEMNVRHSQLAGQRQRAKEEIDGGWLIGVLLCVVSTGKWIIKSEALRKVEQWRELGQLLDLSYPQSLMSRERTNWQPTGQKLVESTLFPRHFNQKMSCDDVESMWKTDWICKKSSTFNLNPMTQ